MTVAPTGTLRRRLALASVTLLACAAPASAIAKRATPRPAAAPVRKSTTATTHKPVTQPAQLKPGKKAATHPAVKAGGKLAATTLPADTAMSARLAKLSARAALHTHTAPAATATAASHQPPTQRNPTLQATTQRPAATTRVSVNSAPIPAPAEPTADAATVSRVHAWLAANDPMRARADASAATASNTAADDAAEQTSHIPSTAPTERVPLPVRTATILPPTAPTLTLAKPVDATPAVIATTLSKPAPAVAAVTKAAKKPKLGPGTAETLSAQNFSDDIVPPIATAPTALAAIRKNPVPAVPEMLDAPAPPATASVETELMVDTRGRMVLLPPMKGSHEILVHQNVMAASDGLDRIGTDAELARMVRTRQLAPLPDTAAVQSNDRLPYNRRYARPWTVRFLQDMGRAYYTRFSTALIVTSAVRTVSFQRKLMRVNGNAAPPSGDTASPHLYGQAVDLGKSGMSMAQIAWLRAYLTPVEAAGKIDVEEEFQQACFHISVYRSYTGAPRPRAQPLPEEPLLQAKSAPAPARPAKHQRISTAMLAAGLRMRR